MPLPAAAHQAVQAERKAMRNAGARANRVRVADCRVLSAVEVWPRTADTGGATHRLVWSGKEPERCYIVSTGKDGGYVCGCFNWRWRHICSHVEAVEAAEETAK